MVEDDEADSLTGNEAVLIYSAAGGRLSGYNQIIPLQAAQYQLSIDASDGYRAERGERPNSSINFKTLGETIERIAPWVKEAYAVPRLFNADHEIGGVHCRHNSLIIISYGARSAASVSSILYHELFHAVQKKLVDHWIDDYLDLSSRVNSQALKYDDPEYLDTEHEQSARAFQYFCMLMNSGVTIYFPKKADDPTLSFFLSVYQGEFARQLEEGQTESPMPQRTHKIRSLLPW